MAVWASRYPWLRFTPVFSRADPSWTGHRGWAQDAVVADYPHLGAHEMYACGSEQMTASALETLIRERGVDPERFHADAFVSAVHTPLSIPDQSRTSAAKAHHVNTCQTSVPSVGVVTIKACKKPHQLEYRARPR